jgi:Secreted protein acidic and rich in cysteine Ca binding region/EF hand
MKMKFAIGAGAAMLFAGVAIAANHGGMGHGGMGHGGKERGGHKMMGMMENAPKTRAELQTRVKDHFASVDQNKDGFVTSEERAAMRTTKLSEARGAHFTAMDANKDGTISRAEFDAAHAAGPAGAHGGAGAMHHGRGGTLAGRMMERADANSDGKLSLDEAMTPALARFDRIDTDKDGTISDKERAAAQDSRQERRAKWRERRG